MDDGERYRVALLDWLACAAGGWDEPAPRAARAGADEIAALGAAGHVLDFDDTWLPGIAHLSAPTAPAALVLAADQGATIGTALEAYAAGFEAMAALAQAGHPALYDGGWHPTAVCGTVGAAVAAATLLGADRQRAAALAALRAAGLRAAFGGDGKSLQVGLAASAGAGAARLVAAGASVDLARVQNGWEKTYGAPWADALAEPAIRTNWIKAYPCCLQTHGAIECAQAARDEMPDGPLTVIAHPVSRQAAGYDDVTTPLEAKFSIPYTTAYTLLHGPPRVESFATVDADACAPATASSPTSVPRAARPSIRSPRRTSLPRSARWRASAWTARSTTSTARRPTSSTRLQIAQLDPLADDLESPAAVVRQRGGSVEVAGVDGHALRAPLPPAPDHRGQQPAAQPASLHAGQDPEVGQVHGAARLALQLAVAGRRAALVGEPQLQPGALGVVLPGGVVPGEAVGPVVLAADLEVEEAMQGAERDLGEPDLYLRARVARRLQPLWAVLLEVPDAHGLHGAPFNQRQQ
jgi:2-methylcitrate dehydratase MmgE/PrpD-like protein